MPLPQGYFTNTDDRICLTIFKKMCLFVPPAICMPSKPETSWIAGLLEFLGVFGFHSARNVLDCWIVGIYRFFCFYPNVSICRGQFASFDTCFRRHIYETGPTIQGCFPNHHRFPQLFWTQPLRVPPSKVAFQIANAFPMQNASNIDTSCHIDTSFPRQIESMDCTGAPRALQASVHCPPSNVAQSRMIPTQMNAPTPPPSYLDPAVQINT